MDGIIINAPGFQTSIQDRGRFGLQWSGMCPAGAMDMHSLSIANILVGNSRGEAGLEVTMIGPDMTFTADNIIAITGADLSPTLDGAPFPMYAASCVRVGQRLKFGMCKSGCRAYIAFAGGIDTPVLYGSKSTLLRIGIGGIDGGALKKGDQIAFVSPESTLPNMAARAIAREKIDSKEVTLRVIMGPQDYLFSEKGIANFFSSEGYTVSALANRQGYRLDGEPVEMIKIGSIVSDGIANGAIQIPPNQKPIVLLAERQSTGGYAKIANVISVDLPKIGQAMTGSRIRFKAVSVEEAEKLLAAEEEYLAGIEQDIQNAHVRSYTLSFNGTQYEVAVHKVSNRRRPQ